MHELFHTAKGEGMSGCDCHLRSARAERIVGRHLSERDIRIGKCLLPEAC